MELCIDFGGTELKLAVTDGAEILVADRIPMHDDRDALATAASAASALLRRDALAASTLEAVGIAVPGVVHPRTERMLHANAKHDLLRSADLHSWASAAFGAPAVVENDARAALIGETSAAGSAPGEKDAVLMTLGTGIGTAAVIGGTVLRGASGHAGILGGHVTVDLAAARCPCGNRGCAELLASTWALTVSGRDRDGIRGLLESAAPADEKLFAHFLDVWAASVVTLCHMYDPTTVILSGGVLRGGDAILRPIETYVRTHLWSSLTPPRFVVPAQPEYSVVRGLGVLAKDRARQHTHPRPAPQ